MIYQELRPHPVLQDYLACYFFLQVEAGAPVGEELVIPDGTPGLMFVQKERFTRYCPADRERQQVRGSYLFGQKTRAVRYTFDMPGLDCFGVKFQPHGLKAFTRMPAWELTDTRTDAAPALGDGFAELEDRLSSTPAPLEKKQLLDNFFIRRLHPDPDPDHLLIHRILVYIHRYQGQVDVAGLVQFFNLNYKRLERLFQKFVGLNPKTYCRLTRFNATLLHQERRRDDNLTQLAYSAGYFDQMHFIKEVKHFTSLTPKEFYYPQLGRLAIQQRQLVRERLA